MPQLRPIAITLFATLLVVCSAAHGLEIPAGPLMFASYDGVTAPAPDENAAASRPIAFGSVAKGGDSLSLQIRTGQFERPVDLYLGFTARELDPSAILLITATLQIQPLSSGLVPWKAGVLSVDESLFGPVPISPLPQSRYVVYLLAVPAGTAPGALFEKCYLWSSALTTLDLIALSNQAVDQLGGGAEAAAAILLALGGGSSLEKVVRAILAGTLMETVELSVARGPSETGEGPMRPLSSACDIYFGELEDDTFNDITVCRAELILVYQSVIQGLMSGGASEDELKALVTALTILAANRGYSPTQIHEAISEMLLIGSITIDHSGFIWKNCSGILCKNEFRQKVEPLPVDPPAGAIEFRETEEAENEEDSGLGAYGKIMGDICAPILVGSAAVKAEGVFDFSTCPTPYGPPNFTKDLSRVNRVSVSLGNVQGVFERSDGSPDFTHWVDGNYLGEGQVSALSNSFTQTLDYASGGFISIPRRLQQTITIRFNADGSAIESVSANYSITDYPGQAGAFVSTYRSMQLSGHIPLTNYIGNIGNLAQSAIYALKGSGVCGLVTNTVQELTLNAGEAPYSSLDPTTIVCDERSYISIALNESNTPL